MYLAEERIKLLEKRKNERKQKRKMEAAAAKQAEEEYQGRYSKSALERAAGGRACNYVKFKPGRNLLPILKIVTCLVHAGLK